MCDSTTSDGSERGSLSGNGYDEVITEAVVTTVAEVTEQSPLEMDPLADVVDADALNRIFSGANDKPSSVTVTFDYCGQRITVSGDGVRVH